MSLTGVIVQARMGSTRLPGKIMLDIVPGITMLEMVIRRLKYCKKVDRIIVATTTLPQDNVVEELCCDIGVEVFRGAEKDVLTRYYHCSEQYDLDTIVRVTSDCPAIDPQILDNMIDFYSDNQNNLYNLFNYDYVSNIMERTYPRGFDAEIFSKDVLRSTFMEAKKELEREHVTPYIYSHPDKYRLGCYYNKRSNNDNHQYRLTVDTPEDLILAKKVFKDLWYNDNLFTVDDVVKLFQENIDYKDFLNRFDENITDPNKIKYDSSQYYNKSKRI
jgi:spore coat polysaccharide biosynthesis protein SpsF